MSEAPVINPELAGLKTSRRGKVRHLFDLGDQLALVASDRISAYDCVLPTGIPGKGRLLTQISKFWFAKLESAKPHHLITADAAEMPESIREGAKALDGRTMLVKKSEIVPFECIVRGYLAGSGWKQYQKEQKVQEHSLPPGLRLGDPLPEPLFTPTTKADEGHDEPISFAGLVEAVGQDMADALKARSLAIFKEASEWALTRGLILCDTKFEFGYSENRDPAKLVLCDEVLTPDSSRFFKASEHKPGEAVKPWDKQLVRDYLSGLDWDKTPPAPELPEEIVKETVNRYQEIHDLITGA
ncbi:MAG: phosphoribosylaminoimidazolesuccinocarboxamide synthase [Planctomycetota bacterium]|nr:phosphoribosylaminoimidazolesuccinocarboxamide synthase [Planctomycetota bacterium]